MVMFDFIIGLIAALATWIQFASFGDAAWRLLATWVALIATIYYIVDAAVTLLAKRRPLGTELCPMLQGGLIVAGIMLILIRVVYYTLDSYIPGVGINIMLIEFILPVLMIISWVMFSLKGKWRAHEPFYWLGLLASYVALILVSGELMSRSAPLVYPYEFLNYPSIGIDTMLWWLAIFAVVTLIAGYAFWILDFALSGHLNEHIVMPKIKTVVIEEEVEDEAPAPEIIEKPKEKPVKLVTTGSRNLPVIAAQQATKKTPAKPKTSSDKPHQQTGQQSETDHKSPAEKQPEVKKQAQVEKQAPAEKSNKPTGNPDKSTKAQPAKSEPKAETKPEPKDKPEPKTKAESKAESKPEDSKPTSPPPVRIIEKIDLTESKSSKAKKDGDKPKVTS